MARPQKELPSKFFYDERGSELFEEITRLPEYYLTRAEEELLRDHARPWVGEQRPSSLVELGAGSAEKTRILLDAMTAGGAPATYVPVDISADFLERTATALRLEYPSLQVAPLAADFTRSLVLPAILPHPALLTFLGSTIGNFPLAQAVDLLRRIGRAMREEDRFLLGVDLRKDVTVLEAAYNDSRGLTAEFNRNVLRVLNRRFEADFDPDAFEHRALYNREEHRIEMHLVAGRPQVVRIPGAGEFAFAPGESIRTEISCKYDRPAVTELLTAAGMELIAWWQAPEGPFALALAAAA